MQLVNVTGENIEIEEDNIHSFLIDTKNVAIGFGTSSNNIRVNKKNNSLEFIEGKHFIFEYNNKKQKRMLWTKKGIVRLGFFIKSQRAKQFRDWAEDFILNPHKHINPRTISTMQGHLTRKSNRIALLEKELKELKSMLSNKLLIAQDNECTLKPHKLGKELIQDFVGSVQQQEEAMDMMITEMIRVQKFTTQIKNRFLNNFPEANPHVSYDKALLSKVPFDI